MTSSNESSRSGSSRRDCISIGIRSSRISRFARTIRCAIVYFFVRNARAISSTEKPPTVFNVSAIRLSRGIDG